MARFIDGGLYGEYYNPQKIVDTYYTFGHDCEFSEDALEQPLKEMHNYFSTGAANGDTLIEIGSGPVIHQLISSCECFKEIILSDFTEQCLDAQRKWQNKDPEAFDWSDVVKHVCGLEGNRDKWMEKEEKIRNTVKRIVKCDATKIDPMAPEVLPPADCLLLIYVLEAICCDKEAYCTVLRNISPLVKIGGRVVMLALLGCSFIMCGDFKFPFLCVDEEFVRGAFTKAGFVIEKCCSNPRINQTCYSTKDFSNVLFFVARKETHCE
ncbi:indolethylamine N-methyltransferase-like [Ambystoma mexicanum]|uniref:indolethylamine N-methyltransferase-like n=1 Tax=Ambystoma mexicanum TaxID=8296 RepID=UPI0037E77819